MKTYQESRQRLFPSSEEEGPGAAGRRRSDISNVSAVDTADLCADELDGESEISYDMHDNPGMRLLQSISACELTNAIFTNLYLVILVFSETKYLCRRCLSLGAFRGFVA